MNPEYDHLNMKGMKHSDATYDVAVTESSVESPYSVALEGEVNVESPSENYESTANQQPIKRPNETRNQIPGELLPAKRCSVGDASEGNGKKDRTTIGLVLLALLVIPAIAVAVVALIKSFDETSPDILSFQSDISQLKEMVESLRTENEELKINISDLNIKEGNLSEIISRLQKEVEALEIISKERLTPDPGWFTPSTRYQYRLTDVERNWVDSREWCRIQGGDLAAVGMRNLTLRKIIYDKVTNESRRVWIGLSEVVKDGRFVWVDGIEGTSSNTQWAAEEPNDSGGNEDCCEVYRLNDFYLTNDRTCSASIYGICEKLLW